jgi:putative DNA primase/helicase
MPPDGSGPLWRVLGCLGDSPRKSKNGYEARCPGHDDRHRSLSVGLGDDGRVLLACHAGCSVENVLQGLGLSYSDLFERSQAGYPVRRFRLLNGSGQVVAEHVREDTPDGKKIWWERNGKRGLNGTATADVPLYHGQAIAGTSGPIVLCEGEKAAQALLDVGVLAVATVTGADGTPSDSVLAVLQNREVWLWPDNDDVGRAHMARIALKIRPTPKWIDWRNAPEHGDAADYISGGGTAVGIADLVAREIIPDLIPGPQDLDSTGARCPTIRRDTLGYSNAATCWISDPCRSPQTR